MNPLLQMSAIATCLVLVGFIMIVVGVATKGWISGDFTLSYSTQNSYYNSYYNTYKTYSISGELLPGSSLSSSTGDPKLTAAFALCIIATVLASLTLLGMAAWVLIQFLEKAEEKMYLNFPRYNVYAAELAATFGIIGSLIQMITTVVVYLTAYIPGYSFFLTIIGSIILAIAGGVARKTIPANQVATQMATQMTSQMTTQVYPPAPAQQPMVVTQ